MTDRSAPLAPLLHAMSLAAAEPEPVVRPGAPAVAGERDVVWAALYDRHFDDVYRLVRRAGVSVADAEDVAQKVFLRVHALLAHTPEVTHPLAWLRAITVRVVSEHHRFWRLRRVKQWVVEGVATLGRAATPDEQYATHQAQDQVAAVLRRMSPKLREVLVLAELEDLAPAEVATILGVPVNTVRSRRHLARAQFSALWQRHHGGAP